MPRSTAWIGLGRSGLPSAGIFACISVKARRQGTGGPAPRAGVAGLPIDKARRRQLLIAVTDADADVDAEATAAFLGVDDAMW